MLEDLEYRELDNKTIRLLNRWIYFGMEELQALIVCGKDHRINNNLLHFNLALDLQVTADPRLPINSHHLLDLEVEELRIGIIDVQLKSLLDHFHLELYLLLDLLHLLVNLELLLPIS